MPAYLFITQPNGVAKNALHLDGDLHYEEETLLKRRSGKRVRHKRNNREEDVLRLRSRKIIRKSLKLVIPKPKTLSVQWFITLKVDVVLLETNFMLITTIVNSSNYLPIQWPTLQLLHATRFCWKWRLSSIKPFRGSQWGPSFVKHLKT